MYFVWMASAYQEAVSLCRVTAGLQWVQDALNDTEDNTKFELDIYCFFCTRQAKLVLKSICKHRTVGVYVCECACACACARAQPGRFHDQHAALSDTGIRLWHIIEKREYFFLLHWGNSRTITKLVHRQTRNETKIIHVYRKAFSHAKPVGSKLIAWRRKQKWHGHVLLVTGFLAVVCVGSSSVPIGR
jgi:predicted O-linked N-acetylglucosamine transferase (SPINDLY family)